MRGAIWPERLAAAILLTLLQILVAGAAGSGPTLPSLATPLTAVPGDPVRGRQVVRDINKATCLICHAMPIPEEPDPGNIGPDLAGVGSRFTAAELRQRVVDASVANPGTVMPPYYRRDGLYRVLDRYKDETVYTAQDVEDVVAYLLSLKGP